MADHRHDQELIVLTAFIIHLNSVYGPFNPIVFMAFRCIIATTFHPSH